MCIQCEFYKKNDVGGHHGQREGQPHGPQHLSYVYVEKCGILLSDKAKSHGL